MNIVNSEKIDNSTHSTRIGFIKPKQVEFSELKKNSNNKM